MSGLGGRWKPVLLFVEPVVGQGRHDQASQSWRKARGQRELSRRLDSLEAELGDLGSELASALSTKTCRVDIAFQRAAVPWRHKLHREECHLEVRVFLAPVNLLLTDSQLASVVRRTVIAAVMESGAVAGPLDAPRCVPTPLLQLGAVPSEGIGDRWSSSADLDAYAKAARLIGDLAEPWLVKQELMSAWPMLDLVPKRACTQIVARRDSRAYEVPLALKFAQLPASVRAETVLDDLQVALRLRAAEQSSDWGRQIEALSTQIEVAGFEQHLLTSKLRRPHSPSWLRIEYEADPDGGRCRMVVGGSQQDVHSEWIPVGAGAASVVHLEPGVGYGWMPDGRAWVAPRRGRSRRTVFDPHAEDRDPSPLAAIRGLEDSSAPSAGLANLSVALDRRTGFGGSPATPTQPLEADGGDLPTAHPRFSAHFTAPLYDDAGEDFGPFGSDEGFELVHEWAGRRAELDSGATVARILISEGLTEFERWSRPVKLRDCPDPAALVDEAVFVQIAGFSMLRLAGRIDPEGGLMVLHALDFLIAFYGGPAEYVTQREDLSRWLAGTDTW